MHTHTPRRKQSHMRKKEEAALIPTEFDKFFCLAKPLLTLKLFKTFSSYVSDKKVKHFPKHSWQDASCVGEGERVFLNKK